MERELLNTKKIAVAGIGGVGGYLAAMLGKTYPCLTLGARGQRKASVLKNGLILHSEYKGEITIKTENVVPLSEMGPQDYIFVCVKNYSLEQVCAELSDAVTEDTVIIPVMNGVDPGDRIRRILGKGIVVDSLIYIVAFANDDFSITQQGNYARLYIGVKDADERQKNKVAEVNQILNAAGVECIVADDIECEIWRKYILNCAYNVSSAYYDNTIGQLRSDPVKCKEYEALVAEAYEVAKAKGVHVKPEHKEAIIHRFYYELADGATSSLQRDIRAGKQAEVDTFSGYIVREGRRLGIDIPVTEKMYAGLAKKKPSMDEWIKEAKKDRNASECGMYLFHTGVVRKSAKAKVRMGDETAGAVSAMEFSYDADKVALAEEKTRRMPGIFYVRVWLNTGRLEVGDDIMLVLVGGDIRPHVVDALQTLVGEIKTNCVTETEIMC